MKIMRGSKRPDPGTSAKLGWRYSLFAVGLVVLALLVMDFNSRMAELRRLTAEQEAVSGELTNQLQTQSALQTQISYATSEDAVADWAYQDGHMVRPGDIPVVPIQPTLVVTPVPSTPVPTPVQMSNWQRWLILFFGSSMP